ncbi:MAG: BamA/TamA family outer membrane protein [Myxococcota bacterium]
MIPLLIIAGLGCAKHDPPPWLTAVTVTGANPRPGIPGLTSDPDLPALGPHLTDRFASRRTLWTVRAEIAHPWSRWWQFLPVAPTVLGYRRSTVDRALLDADAERISVFFAEHGWRDASTEVELRRPSLWIARVFRSPKRNRTLEAHFEVDVGARYRLDTWALTGDLVDFDPVGLAPGTPWGLEAERELLARLQDAAESDGYGRAVVSLTQESDANGLTRIEAHVERGPAGVFGLVTLSGNSDLSDAALRRTIGRSVAEGLPWNPGRVDRLERRLLRMPGIADATIEKLATPAGTVGADVVPLRVHVVESPRDMVEPANEIIGRPGTFTLIVGATWIRRHVLGANTWSRLHGALGYRHIWRDVWGGDSGPAASVGLGLDVSLEPTATLFLHQSVDAELDQWHGYHYGRADAEVGPSWQRGPASIWAGARSTGFLAFPFPLQQPVFDRFFETADDGNGPLERSYVLHQSVVHAEVDTIDDPTNPHGGGRFTIDAIPYGRVEGATLRRVELDLDTYWPTAWSLLTLRARVGGGLLDVQPTNGSTVGVLLGHRVYGGGPYIVRGWVDRSILPPGTDWSPGEPRAGGNVEAHATLEPRFHLNPNATLTGFLDAASVWEDLDDVSADTLRWSTGGGIRFPLVIGEGHLIFAWVVGNPQQELQGGRFRIHLTLDPY